MKDERIMEELEKQGGGKPEDAITLFAAVTQAYPVIALENLTKNTYTLIRKAGLEGEKIVTSGNYDDLVRIGMENTHPNFQKQYMDSFSRERLLYQYGQGKHDVCAKLYQKNWRKQYYWAYTHTIRVHGADGDVCAISLGRPAEEINGTETESIRIGRTFKELEELNGIGEKEVNAVLDAVSQIYPMIVMSNLSRNRYTMLKDEGFLAEDLPAAGSYDDLIDIGREYIHPNYRKVFLDNFERGNQMYQFGQGRREVYEKIYQKGRLGQYQWVSIHVIRVQDQDGDICSICFNRVLDDAVKSKERIGRDYY